MSRDFISGRWRCCGKSHRTEFCPSCGKSKPRISDAHDLLVHFQMERDAAESAADTFREKHDELARLYDRISRGEIITGKDVAAVSGKIPFEFDERPDIKKHQIGRECESADAAQQGWLRRAAQWSKWISILSELMQKAGVEEF